MGKYGAWAALLAGVIAACGGKVDDGSSDGGGGTTSNDGGGNGNGKDTGGFEVCPFNDPTPGATCTDPTLGCDYYVGSQCTRYLCVQGVWSQPSGC